MPQYFSVLVGTPLQVLQSDLILQDFESAFCSTHQCRDRTWVEPKIKCSHHCLIGSKGNIPEPCWDEKTEVDNCLIVEFGTKESPCPPRPACFILTLLRSERHTAQFGFFWMHCFLISLPEVRVNGAKPCSRPILGWKGLSGKSWSNSRFKSKINKSQTITILPQSNIVIKNFHHAVQMEWFFFLVYLRRVVFLSSKRVDHAHGDPSLVRTLSTEFPVLHRRPITQTHSSWSIWHSNLIRLDSDKVPKFSVDHTRNGENSVQGWTDTACFVWNSEGDSGVTHHTSFGLGCSEQIVRFYARGTGTQVIWTRARSHKIYFSKCPFSWEGQIRLEKHHF